MLFTGTKLMVIFEVPVRQTVHLNMSKRDMWLLATDWHDCHSFSLAACTQAREAHPKDTLPSNGFRLTLVLCS